MLVAVMGGALIGIAVSVLLLFNGRVTGVSGIVSGLIKPISNDWAWRLFFVLGLLSGGLLLKIFYPISFEQNSHANTFDYILAGLLVGFGTLLGNGCTSGHGVCGISRLSLRSILSTLTFMFFGILSVLVYKMIRGEL